MNDEINKIVIARRNVKVTNICLDALSKRIVFGVWIATPQEF